MDMGVYNPYNHRWDPSQTYNSMNWYRSIIFMPVSTSSIQRGDVIYYRGHIAIALGGGLMIDSWPHQGVGIHPISARGKCNRRSSSVYLIDSLQDSRYRLGA